MNQGQAAHKTFVKAALAALLGVSAFSWGGAPPAAAQAPETDQETCWAVSDSNAEERDSDAEDLLVHIDRGDADPATNETDIGHTGTFNIEAIALQPGTATLFAADAGRLGTLDTATGQFTAIGTIGEGSGDRGEMKFDDVDGLHFDPATGVLYGSQREKRGDDLLLRIDPATGSAVAGGISGSDYVVVEAVPGLSDIDDLAIDPTDGQMYAIANTDGRGDHLVRIDKSDGSVTDVGTLTVEDMEGLSFAPDGQLIGTTGKVHDEESIADIDKATGKASNLRPLDNSDDYEALACLVAPPAPAAAPAAPPVPAAPAALTIVEDAVPDDPVDFPFTGTACFAAEGRTLDDDPASPMPNSTTCPDLPAGVYTVGQAPVAGWPLIGLSCTDPSGGTTTDQPAAAVSVDLAPGEHVTCVFVNARRAAAAAPSPAPGTASLTVVEDAVPDDPVDFSFTGTGCLGPDGRTLDDDPASPTPNSTTCPALPAGVYTANQAPVEGWPLTSLDCADPTGATATDPRAGSASVDLATGEHVTCTFVNSPTQVLGEQMRRALGVPELPRTGPDPAPLRLAAGLALTLGGLGVFAGAKRRLAATRSMS